MPDAFDPNAGMDPLSLLLMGGAAGLGQAGATSRLPISAASVFGGLGAGLMAGQRAANQSQLEQQEAVSRAAANQMLLSQLGMMQGQGAPTGRDVLSGKFRLDPDLSKLLPGMFGGTPAQQAAPQLPMPAGGGGALPAVPNATAQMGVGGKSDLIRKAMMTAQNNGFDPQFAVPHINGESGFDPNAVGPAVTGNSLYPGKPQARPLGLAQLAPDTAKEWGVADPMNPDQALEGYGKLFKSLLDKNDGDYVKATQAYGTIPHDLSKMDTNQQQVYMQAVAANARAKSGPLQVAQNIPGAPATDAQVGQSAQQPSAPVAQLDPRIAAAQNLFRQRMLPMTPIEQANMNARLYPPGSAERTQLENYASKLSGVEPFKGGERPNAPLLQATGDPNNPYRVVNPAGYNEAVRGRAAAEAGGRATVEPQTIVDPVTGAPYATSRANAFAPGMPPVPTGLSPEAHAGAEARGRAPFEPPVETFAPGGVPQQTPRQNLPGAFGPMASGLPQVGSPSPTPAAAPATQLGQADFDRLKAAGVPDATIQSIQQAQKAQQPQQVPEAAPAAFQMNTPAGPKPVTQVHVNDMFPGGAGIPQPPAPPPGSGYGPPTEFQKEVQKDDAGRIEQYNKEQSAAQKQYQDLLHLREVLNAGFTTGRAAKIGSDYANLAHSLGADWAYSKGWAPANAAEFDKASTDLVFAALKSLPGQPRVSEITGLQKANPSLAIPRETNFNMMNDILASNKWQDERARLATEFKAVNPGAPLSVFDTAYNRQAPLVDVTNEYKGIMRQHGALFPEESPAGGFEPVSSVKAPLPGKMPPGAIDSRTVGGKVWYNFGTQEAPHWARPGGQ